MGQGPTRQDAQLLFPVRLHGLLNPPSQVPGRPMLGQRRLVHADVTGPQKRRGDAATPVTPRHRRPKRASTRRHQVGFRELQGVSRSRRDVRTAQRGHAASAWFRASCVMALHDYRRRVRADGWNQSGQFRGVNKSVVIPGSERIDSPMSGLGLARPPTTSLSSARKSWMAGLRRP
jgi:hypothetical protein